ncbi:MAG: hypothetical protein Tsb0016_07920 [Sphingomonadales bacterium]
MPQVVVSALINQPQQAVWDAWADFAGIEKFHPGVKASNIISIQKAGTGTVRRCEFYDGSAIEERLSVVAAPSSIGWAMTKAPGPLKSGDALVQLEARGPNQTAVIFTLDYAMKMGPIGALLGATVVKGAMKKALGGLLKGLEDHLKTGKRVGKNGALAA